MHWELESGLQLMQRRENLNYNYDYTTLDQSLKITDVKIYHPNLDPKYVQVVDTVYQIRTQNVNRNQNNTYTYLSIPLIARYNFYFPKAWSVNAAAGLLTDVYQTNKGAVMANTRESVAINSIAKSTQFNQRILVSAGVKLKASEHWSILAEPVAIFGVNNMMTPGYSLKQKEFGLMFNTGLRYNF
jgi:ABC-type antimicrobial peptide transport system permease subunit